MSTSRDQTIIEEAREFVDAARNYERVSEHIGSVHRTGLSKLYQAKNTEELEKINAEQQEQITRAIDEAQRRISSPIIALNDLVGASDAPVFFEYHDQELRLVPKNDPSNPYRRFAIERRDGGSWTSV